MLACVACSSLPDAGYLHSRLQIEVTWGLHALHSAMLLWSHSVPQCHELALLRHARRIRVLVLARLLHI